MDLETGGLGNILHFKISDGEDWYEGAKRACLAHGPGKSLTVSEAGRKTAGSGQATSENVSKEGQPLESSKAQGHFLERILTRSL